MASPPADQVYLRVSGELHQPYIPLQFFTDNGPKYYFNIQVCVGTNSSHDPHSSCSTSFLSCQEFFLDAGVPFLLGKLSHPALPDETVDSIMEDVMFAAQRLFSEHHRSRSRNSASRTIPLGVQVVILMPDAEEEAAMEESMQQVRMVPASKEAIESLNKVKVQSAKVLDPCSICQEEYDDGEEILQMPCHHCYHQYCILQWLQTSHLCPLCRYPMPV